ncbi:hypothetical protein COLO4_25090 [Corchorus olitorius]|uniref:Uncharacterized protein n=1 Tax=Corchorus olitorius TaxID=93759 RepID=A0A1R3I4M5_9ROSI|nr:hypothetical protein COLO4_25090 [Corchorus olitorius]
MGVELALMIQQVSSNSTLAAEWGLVVNSSLFKVIIFGG